MSAQQRAPFDPQQFERLSAGTVPGYAAMQELVALAAAAVAPTYPAAVLDLGCGTGTGIVALSRALPAAHLTGCDPSQPMIAAARARCEAAGVRAQLVDGDLYTIAPDVCFDVIVCTLVLHFVPPHERVTLLSAMRSRLRSGGSLVITALGRSMDPAVQAVWTQLRRDYAISNGIAPTELAQRDTQSRETVFPIAQDDLAATLRDAGFTSITPLCQILAVHSWLARTQAAAG